MRAIVKRWGNSASVRIPSALMEAADLELGDIVEVREEGGRIIIEPVPHKRYDLAKMLAGITARNQHGETDLGPAVGREIL